MKTDAEIIEEIGGAARIAELCNITISAVVQWKHKGIPAARRQFLQLLYPDAFGLRRRPIKLPQVDADVNG